MPICQNVAFADTASSAEIVKNGRQLDTATEGRWKLVGSGRGKHQFKWGFVTDESQTDGESVWLTQQANLSAQMRTGINFKAPGSDSQMLSDEIQQLTIQQVEETFEAYGGIEIEVECGLPKFSSNNSIGFFVFVVDTVDGVSSAIQKHGVCRYGDEWNVPPSCPYAACIDRDCSLCKDWY